MSINFDLVQGNSNSEQASADQFGLDLDKIARLYAEESVSQLTALSTSLAGRQVVHQQEASVAGQGGLVFDRDLSEHDSTKLAALQDLVDQEVEASLSVPDDLRDLAEFFARRDLSGEAVNGALEEAVKNGNELFVQQLLDSQLVTNIDNAYEYAVLNNKNVMIEKLKNSNIQITNDCVYGIWRGKGLLEPVSVDAGKKRCCVIL